MWIKTQAGKLTQTTPSAAIEVRRGLELHNQEVETQRGVRFVNRPEFDPKQHALVLWRGTVPVPVAQGDENLMARLQDRVFDALKARTTCFDVSIEVGRMAKAARKRAKRRRGRGGGDEAQDQPAS